MSKRYRNAHPCPTATKTAYSDKATADADLAQIASLPTDWRSYKLVRSYRCECGRWHLTSRARSYAKIAELDTPG